MLAWLFARSEGAPFLLRIEDLDAGRVREGFIGEQIGDLRALALDWDGEPVRQSGRGVLYADALVRLSAEGRVFPCFCSRREIREAASAQHGELPEGFYPGTCLRLAGAEVSRRIGEGEPHALRLRADGAEPAFADRLAGELRGRADDVVLRRRDGAWAYNLAVVVDDDEQGVGEVVRGDDLLPSTAGQALLCDLLGIERPLWTHVPLVLGPDGERLAKRHGDVTLGALAAAGSDVAEVLGWMASTLGMAERGERFAAAGELLDRFDSRRLPPEPTIFHGDLSAV